MNAKEIQDYIGRLTDKEKGIFFHHLKKWNDLKISPEQSKLIRDAKALIEYANKAWGRNFRETDKHIKAIALRIKQYSFEICQAVIDKKKNDGFFRKNPKYLNFDTVFTRHFDKYAAEIDTVNEEDFDF